MDQAEYLKLKRSVSGLYQQFNGKVLASGIREIFDYNELLNSAKEHKTFGDFFNYHTKDRTELIDIVVEKMFNQNENEFKGLTKEKVYACLVSRLGNIYNGKFMEHKIITNFNSIEDYIKCIETSVDIDINYKVDAIITVEGIGDFAIQIKPLSFKSYDKGSELPYHKQFELENNMKVYYVLYRDQDTIFFNGELVSLYDKNKIGDIIMSYI
jgi:hypothetical protein